jgi:hypothetical protein
MARKEVTIEVTPKLQQGSTVVCEIDPAPGSNPHVKGGVIKLKKDDSYKLVFDIQPGDFAGVEFDTNGAIWCDMNSCPTGPGNNSNGQMKNPVVGPATRLSVDVDPDGTKNAVHYRLNFNVGNYDPIIIHE